MHPSSSPEQPFSTTGTNRLALYAGDVLPERFLTLDELAAHPWRVDERVWVEDARGMAIGEVGIDRHGWWYKRQLSSGSTRWHVGSAAEAVSRLANRGYITKPTAPAGAADAPGRAQPAADPAEGQAPGERNVALACAELRAARSRHLLNVKPDQGVLAHLDTALELLGGTP